MILTYTHWRRGIMKPKTVPNAQTTRF
jgi:hypothetical protein